MRLRSYLFAAILIAAAVPLLIAAYFRTTELAEQEKMAKETQSQYAVLVADNIAGRLESAKDILSLSALIVSDTKHPEEKNLALLLEKIQLIFPEFLSLHFDNSYGVCVASWPEYNRDGESNIGANHRSKEHWRRILTGSYTIGNSYGVLDSDSDRTASIVGTPAPSDPPLYPVGFLNLTELAQETLSQFPKVGYVIWVFDGQGNAVYQSDSPETRLRPLPEKILNQLRNVKNVVWEEATSFTGEKLEGAFEKIKGTDWSVGVLREIQEEKLSKVWTFTIVFCVGLAVILLSILVSAIASRPFVRAAAKLKRQIQERKRLSNPDEELNGPAEIAELQRAYSDSLDESNPSSEGNSKDSRQN